MKLLGSEDKFDDSVWPLKTIHQRDRQTDRQIDKRTDRQTNKRTNIQKCRVAFFCDSVEYELAHLK